MNPLSPEDAEDCGFCVFMRAGPCGAEFRAWEECVKRYQNEDFAHKCVTATRALTTCMSNNKEYYEMPDLAPKQENSETSTMADKHGNDEGQAR